MNRIPFLYLVIRITSLGVYDNKVSELARASTYDQHGRNASRNLHSYVHRNRKTLPVKVTGVKQTPIRGTSKYKKPGLCSWPVLHLSDWIKTGFEDPFKGHFSLGGSTQKLTCQ